MGWSAGAQLSLMVVMFLGRLRGLPEAVDPSVSFVVETIAVEQRDGNIGFWSASLHGASIRVRVRRRSITCWTTIALKTTRAFGLHEEADHGNRSVFGCVNNPNLLDGGI